MDGVKKVSSQGSAVVILKLDKFLFNLDNDIHLFFIYFSPQYSSYSIRTEMDLFTELEQKIASLGPQSDFLLLGDFNARTGSKLDYIVCENNSELTLPDNYIADPVAIHGRGNKDTISNC